MTENSTTISPALLGASSAVVGLGAGYVLAPKKYNLERLLTKSSDTFERTFTPDVMKDATAAERVSLSNLKKAALEYRASGLPIQKNTIAPEAKNWKRLKDAVTIDQALLDTAKEKKAAYLKAWKDSNYSDLKSKLQLAQESASKKPNDATVNLELKTISKSFTEAQKALEVPTTDYKNARAAIFSAREEAVKVSTDKGKAIFEQFKKVKKGISDKADVMYQKLAELARNESLNKDYKSVKKFIPRARTHSAIIGGIFLGLAGILTGVYFSSQKITKKDEIPMLFL